MDIGFSVYGMKMDMLKLRTLWVAGVVALAGMNMHCASQVTPPPQTLAEYEQMRVHSPDAYPRKTILMKNLQRVLDNHLATPERLESLKLVSFLGESDPAVQQRLATVLGDENSPYEVSQGVLDILLKSDYPGLAGYVVPALCRTDLDPILRDSILVWLTNNPSPEVLGEVIKLWAKDPVNGDNEQRYQRIVEVVARKKWPDALMEGLNSPDVFPRAEALQILTQRQPIDVLKKTLMSVPPNNQMMAALQSFVENFDYFPTTSAEFEATEILFTHRLKQISEASRLYRQWAEEYGYQFKVNDFHLLSRMANDPLRTMLRRSDLILTLGQTLLPRQHVRYSSRQSDKAAIDTDEFPMQAQNLTMADLWNLYLINEMLTRPRIQSALKIIADRNRSEAGGPRSGLIFYQHGLVEAMLYPNSGERNARGQIKPSPKMVSDGCDALCRFYTHFEKVYNAGEVGPSLQEMQDAKEGSYYGLTLTSINEYAFSAHYYTPSGRIVSLGKFPFRQEKEE
jgi:hypothetical protein